MIEYEMTGNSPRSLPEREHAWPIYDIFDTAGGERIFIGIVTEGHSQSFCWEFGMTEVLEDPGLRTTTDPILERSRRIPCAAEIIKGWNAADLSATLDRLNICFSQINQPEDMFNDPHVLRPAVWSIISTQTASRSALPVEWNGASIGEGLKDAGARRRCLSRSG
jgi:crotonobetainyl-CoA:carnitine CoA-transferase CaiB-like acyl-CoA transferase